MLPAAPDDAGAPKPARPELGRERSSSWGLIAAMPGLRAAVKEDSPKPAAPALEVRPAAAPVKVDGVLDEAAPGKRGPKGHPLRIGPRENTPRLP